MPAISHDNTASVRDFESAHRLEQYPKMMATASGRQILAMLSVELHGFGEGGYKGDYYHSKETVAIRRIMRDLESAMETMDTKAFDAAVDSMRGWPCFRQSLGEVPLASAFPVADVLENGISSHEGGKALNVTNGVAYSYGFEMLAALRDYRTEISKRKSVVDKSLADTAHEVRSNIAQVLR